MGRIFLNPDVPWHIKRHDFLVFCAADLRVSLSCFFALEKYWQGSYKTESLTMGRRTKPKGNKANITQEKVLGKS